MIRIVFYLALLTLAGAATAQNSWTNFYGDPSLSPDQGWAIALDTNGTVFVTGWSTGSSSSRDYATIAYSNTGLPLWTNRYDGPGDGDDEATDIAVDRAGNVTVTGFSIGPAGYYDYATVRYSNAGTPLWTNVYDGPGGGHDLAYAIAADTNSNVFVTGYSLGAAGNYDYATIKYSAAGATLWVNRYDGPGNGHDYARGIAADRGGNVIVTGYSLGSGGTFDYATIKYSAAGVPLWTNRYDGPAAATDEAWAVAVDGSGNVFVTGVSDGGVTSYDYATIKYSSAGVPLWTNRYDGPASGLDFAKSLALDPSGNIIVTGWSTNNGNGYDFATVKYSNAGLPLWTNRYDGPGGSDDYATKVTTDRRGNVFVTGYSISSNLDYDYATIAYTSAGTPLWTNRFDGSGNYYDAAEAIAVDAAGNVFVTGYSTSSAGDYDFATIKYPAVATTPVTILTTGAGFGLSNGLFGFLISGPAGSNVVIQASTNLQTWSSLKTNALDSGTAYFSDSQSATNRRRFYRALLSP